MRTARQIVELAKLKDQIRKLIERLRDPEAKVTRRALAEWLEKQIGDPR